MSSSDSGGEVIFYLIVAVIIIGLAVTAFSILIAAGATWGAGHSVVNYVRSFRKNVAPEKVTT